MNISNANNSGKIANDKNIDPSEVNKFSALASQWWDKTGPCKPLHDINPLRLGYIANFADLSKAKVLDVGCGGGILAETMAEKGAQVTAIDASEEVITIARLHSLESQIKVNYETKSVQDLSEEQPHTFDIVTCMELLEHVPAPEEIVRACAKLVKPDGKVFFSTLNRNLKSYLFAILGAEYILRLLPRGTHDYAKFIRPSELAMWARSSGLRLNASTGLAYNPLTQIYSLTDDISVNYIAYFQAST